MAILSLTPGFRFHPTDVELVMFYLKRKLMGRKFRFLAISEVNIYKFSPWDLPDKSCLQNKDREWYFFCPRERKYANGSRASRSTENGYWKATGKDRDVLYNKQTVGMVKTCVFHLGRPPKGERTDWVMHEYRNVDKVLTDAGVVQDSYVLCKIFKKSGPGPNNGSHYGAPFSEEDWSDGEEDNLSPEALVLPNNQNDSVLTSTLLTGSTCSASLSEAGPSNVVPSEEALQPLPDDDDLSWLLDMLVEDDPLLSSENDNAKVSNINPDKSSEGAVSSLDGNDMFNSLGDLDIWKSDCAPSSMPSVHDAFVELNDLDLPLEFPAEVGGSESFPTDSLYGSYNCYNYDEQNSYQLDSFGATTHVSGFTPTVTPEECNGCGDHFW